MNKFKSYIIGTAAAIALGSCFTSCQDDFEAPAPWAPVASVEANTTIAEVKEWLWRNDDNYCDTIFSRSYYLNETDNPWGGEEIVIAGRVISSDYAGNCFKYIILQDETGALSFSINSYNLYLEYRRGQEVVVKLTGLFAGKYSGLMQVGFPDFYAAINGNQTSFMAPEFFASHRELNGMPEINKIDTIPVTSFSEMGTNPEELRKWQSQLIRINNVTITQSQTAIADGVTTLSTYHASRFNQVVSDGSENVYLQTSGYANFWNTELPEGPVDLIALVGYYPTSSSSADDGVSLPWQLTLIDINGIVKDPTLPKGSSQNPYTIGEAIDLQTNPESPVTAWVKGYIVGTVAPEVTTITSNEDIEWNDSPILRNTMVIGPTADCKDYVQCLVFELPSESAIYDQSIKANPANYGKEIAVRGTFTGFMGTFGLATPGSANDFILEGAGGGDDTPELPEGVISVAQALDLINSGSYSETEEYKVMGYISSIEEVETDKYGNATYNITDKGSVSALKIYHGYWLDGVRFTSQDQIKVGDLVIVQGKLTLFYNTPEMTQGNKIISYNGSGTGGGASSGDYSETFGSSQGGFTIENVSLSPSLSYVWKYDDSYHYMKASAYVSGASYASDSWLISPMITLGTSSVFSFDQAVNQFKTLDVSKQQISVAIRPEGGSWQTLTVPSWPTSLSWNFVSSGNISLAAYSGQKVQLGFHYTSEDGSSGAWEIKNVLVTNASADGSSGGGGTVTPPVTGGLLETFGYGMGFPEGSANVPKVETEYTSSKTGIKYTLYGAYCNTAYLMLNRANYEGAFISWSLDVDCSAIKMSTTSGCSTQAGNKVGVYADGNLIGEYPTNVTDATVVVDIPAAYQKAGTVYKVMSAGDKNTQFASFEYVESDGSTGDTPGTDNPGQDAGDFKGDFNSFNNGTATTKYGTYTNATGWTAENCAILSGGTGSNPHFAFIGSETTIAPTLNGNPETPGKIYSGTLTGGCNKLTFNYGIAYTETANPQFTVNVKQNGTVVKTQTATVATADKQKAQTFTMEVGVTGNFEIEIVNGVSARSATEFQRVSIWNLTWN